MMASAVSQKPAVMRTGAFRPATVSRRTLVVSASYKNKENIDLSNLPKFQRHGADTGSTEVQLARITMRVGQLSAHLANNKKDNSSRRGLQALLAQRKSLLQYLYRNDRDSYDRILKDLSLRSVVTNDNRGTARKAEEPATAQ